MVFCTSSVSAFEFKQNFEENFNLLEASYYIIGDQHWTTSGPISVVSSGGSVPTLEGTKCLRVENNYNEALPVAAYAEPLGTFNYSSMWFHAIVCWKDAFGGGFALKNYREHNITYVRVNPTTNMVSGNTRGYSGTWVDSSYQCSIGIAYHFWMHLTAPTTASSNDGVLDVYVSTTRFRPPSSQLHMTNINTPVRATCLAGDNQGRPCDSADDCPSSTCTGENTPDYNKIGGFAVEAGLVGDTEERVVYYDQIIIRDTEIGDAPIN